MSSQATLSHCMPTQREAEETREGEAKKNEWYLLSMRPQEQ